MLNMLTPPLLSSPGDYSLFELRETPCWSLPLAAVGTMVPEGVGDSEVNGAEAEMSVWPDFLSLEILQTMNFLNICSSQQELLFLTYLSSSVIP